MRLSIFALFSLEFLLSPAITPILAASSILADAALCPTNEWKARPHVIVEDVKLPWGRPSLSQEKFNQLISTTWTTTEAPPSTPIYSAVSFAPLERPF